MEFVRSSFCGGGECVEVNFTSSSFCESGNCVEIGLTRSSYCDTGACVEVELTRSSYCDTGTCVEVGHKDPDTVLVRDSKNWNSPVLTFNREEWIAFVKGVKAGEFDLE